MQEGVFYFYDSYLLFADSFKILKQKLPRSNAV